MKDSGPDTAEVDRRAVEGQGLRSRTGSPPPLHLLEIAYATFATLVYLGVLFGLNVGDTEGELAIDAMATVNQAVVLLGGIGFALRHRHACAAALGDVWPFLLLLALAVLSGLWSQAPLSSLRRSLTLATLLLFAASAHAVFGTFLMCRIQVAAMWIAAFASFAVAALVPASGFDVGSYAGAVRGVFTQKNNLGDAMVVGMIALSGLVMHRRRIVPTDLASIALALGTVVLAQATTSLLLCLAVGLATAVILLVLDGRPLARFCLLSGLMAAFLAAWIVYAVPIDVFTVLGKDSSLTGRTEVWSAVRHAIADGSALGYGYSAFWLPETQAAQNVWAAIGWITPSAHSGYLEVQLELGLPGLVLVAVLALTSLGVAGRAWWAGRYAAAGLLLIVLMVGTIVNYDESSLPRPDIHLLQWILAFAACSAGARADAAPTRVPGEDFSLTRLSP
jgi:O-antigen ligase